jgi:tetratricopeptide (TPR) repeat protein
VFKLSSAGILLFSASLYAQFPIIQTPAHIVHATAPLTASGERSLFDDFPPLPSESRPIGGVVSVHDLQHPIPRKATQKAFDAQKLTKANKIPQAIAKLEEAVRIAPEYRDAHWNLGALYGRLGRIDEARAQFQKALEIGPPAAPIYLNLALISLDAQEYADAQNWAAKALELEPRNELAQRARETALKH